MAVIREALTDSVTGRDRLPRMVSCRSAAVVIVHRHVRAAFLATALPHQKRQNLHLTSNVAMPPLRSNIIATQTSPCCLRERQQGKLSQTSHQLCRTHCIEAATTGAPFLGASRPIGRLPNPRTIARQLAGSCPDAFPSVSRARPSPPLTLRFSVHTLDPSIR